MGALRATAFPTMHSSRSARVLRLFLSLLLTVGLLSDSLFALLGTVSPVYAADQSIGGDTVTYLPLVAGQRAGHLQGVVFRDDDYDGVRDAAEAPVPGVTVKVYDRAGASQMAVSDAAGAYQFSGLRPGEPYRVEFAPLPAGFRASPQGQNSHSSVRFASAADSAEQSAGQPVDFGLIDLLRGNVGNCVVGADVPLATTCYTFGSRITAAQEPAIVSFSSQAGSAGRSPDTPLAAYDDPDGAGAGAGQPFTEATTAILGSVNGLAYQRAGNLLFAAAFMKRHSEFGQNGPGAIYRIDRNATAGNNVSVLTVVADAGVDPHPAGTNFLSDPAFDQVGKIGLGDLEISQDGATLYTINLATRTLVEIPVSQPTPTTLGVVPDPGCVSGVGRPFALALRANLLFVGGVCTAENSGQAANLQAYVYTYDLNLRRFGVAPVLAFALNYPRGCADRNQSSVQCKGLAAWQPWVSAVGQLPDPHSGEFYIHPQPWLTDIEFDGEALVLGFRDRMGDLFGVKTGPPIGEPRRCNGNLCSSISAGDILRAGPLAGSPGQWMVEQNATIGANTTAGANNGQGPGNGEYYFEESYGLGVTRPRHDETAQGGLAQLPGDTGIATTALNPVPFDVPATTFDGGVTWLSNTTGVRTRSYRVYDGTANPATESPRLFGKNNGLGDLELLCGANPPPLEIGNRVWLDHNGNGVQDAGEPGIGGVKVALYAIDGGASVLVGEATTAADSGDYYFGGLQNQNLLSGRTLTPETSYQLRVDLQDPALPADVTPTQPNSQLYNDGFDDLRDADGDHGGLVAGFSTIALTTGQLGHNDHSFDFGFVVPLVALGNFVWEDGANDPSANVIRGNGRVDTGEQGIARVELWLYAGASINGARVMTTTTDAAGFYLFDRLPPGDYLVHIPPSEFQSGVLSGPLAGLPSSLPKGGDTAQDDDADENGQGTGLMDSTGISSTVINLALGAEPVAETGQKGALTSLLPDANVNLTVDFGFFAESPPPPSSVGLGNRVWRDESRGGFDNGLLDAGEEGIDGVTLHLYEDTQPDGIPDGQAILTTTTISGGHYLFQIPLPTRVTDIHHYIVEVAASNFAAGGPLANLVNSTPTEADPNADVDSNDNGINTPDPRTTGIRSGVATLQVNTEPTGEPHAALPSCGRPTVDVIDDDNCNLTVDFGFYQVPPIPGIDIEKNTDSPANLNPTTPDFDNEDEAHGVGVPVIPAGSPAVWSYKVTNTGQVPFVRDNVTVRDTTASVSAALVFDSASDVGSDDVLSPGEVWLYTSTGVALDLRNPPNPLPEGVVIVDGCSQSVGGGLQPTQTYSNTATVVGIVEVAGQDVTLTDADDSHYCNDTVAPPTFSLGNRVWLDDGPAGFNNGLHDASEPGVANVTLALFPAEQADGAAILTTTTDADGYYLFTGLAAGQYLVEVAASNFAPTGPLAGRVNSVFTEADPNLDGDQNDNGINAAGYLTQGVRSGVVTLALASEPIGEPDQGPGCGATPDANCNLTVDFGFYTTNSCLAPDTGELMMPKQVITVTGVSAAGVITEGPGVYTLPQGYDHLIVKRFGEDDNPDQPDLQCGNVATSFCFKVAPGNVYTSTKLNPNHPERVWACKGSRQYCNLFTAAYAKQHNVPLDLAAPSVPPGNSVLLFLLDDDKDDRVSSLLKNGTVVEPITQTLGLPESKLSECGSFDITESANWQIQADDSIGIASCVVPTATVATFKNLFCPANP